MWIVPRRPYVRTSVRSCHSARCMLECVSPVTRSPSDSSALDITCAWIPHTVRTTSAELGLGVSSECRASRCCQPSRQSTRRRSDCERQLPGALSRASDTDRALVGVHARDAHLQLVARNEGWTTRELGIQAAHLDACPAPTGAEHRGAERSTARLRG